MKLQVKKKNPTQGEKGRAYNLRRRAALRQPRGERPGKTARAAEATWGKDCKENLTIIN